MSTRSINPTDGGSWGGYSVDKHEDCYICDMALHDATELGETHPCRPEGLIR